MTMGVAPKWIDVDGVRTRYFESGTGEPVLFLTGGHYGGSMFTSTVETWDRNFPVLARRYRVFALDKLGFGHTDNPKERDYTMRALIDHVAGFLKALDLEGVHVVGQSAGALPAAALAYRCPGRIRSCTFINSSTLAPGVSLNEAVLAGCPHPPYSREAQRWLFVQCAHDPAIVSDDFVEAGYEVMQLRKYRECVQAMDGDGLKDALYRPDLARVKRETMSWITDAGVGRPTLVYWGCNDRAATVERGAALYQMIASRENDAQFHVVNRACHHPYREHPEQFNEVMANFLGALR